MAKILVFATFLAFLSAGSAAQSPVISFDEYGFSMVRPTGWHQAEKRVLDDSVKQLDLSDASREKLKKDDDEARLLVLFTRYVPDTKRGVNPKIEVRVVPNGSLTPLPFEVFRDAYSAESRSYIAGRLGYTFLLEPTVIDVTGGKGIYQVTRFTVRNNHRTEFTIRSRTLAIPYKTYCFLIAVVDEFGGEDISAVVDELVKSIKIGNH